MAREIGKLNKQSISNVFNSAVLKNRGMSLNTIYASGRASFLSSPGPSSIPGVLTIIEGKVLCSAAQTGSNTVIQRLIDQGVSANAIDGEGVDALHTSATYGKVEAARLLLENRANVNLILGGGSPLHHAIRARLIGSELPLMRLLLEHGADATARDQDNETPLHRAALEELHDAIKLLLDNGALIEAKQNDLTPLMISSTNRNAAATRLLLERGADLNSALPDTRHDSLCLAVTGNRRRDPSRTQLTGTIKSLIEFGADVDGNTQNVNVPPLSLALMEDGDSQLATVEALLDANADIEKADVTGFTPLETWITFSLWYDTSVLHLLLKRGVNVNRLDKEQNSPLIQACAAAGGHSEEVQGFVVQKLIQYGADVNQADDNGDTPAMLVCINSTLSGWQKYRLL